MDASDESEDGADGGSRATAREIYTRMYEGSADEKVKDMARKRLLQLDSLDQRDCLRKLFAAYQDAHGQVSELRGRKWSRFFARCTSPSMLPVRHSIRAECLTFCARVRVKLISDPKSEIPVK